MLKEYFAENSNKLHVIAMREAQQKYGRQIVATKRLSQRSERIATKVDTRGIEIWMRGVKNAARELEKVAT